VKIRANFVSSNPLPLKPSAADTPHNPLLRDKLRSMRDAARLHLVELQVRHPPRRQLHHDQSQYLNDEGCKYEGDIPTLERKIDDFLRNEDRRRASGVDSVWHNAAEEMKASFEYIRRTNDFGAVIADSGDGKTRAIDLIRDEHPLALLFHVRSWNNDKASLTSALWDCIPHVGYDAQQNAPVHCHLIARGSDRPLIVDDAHKLTRPALHLLFDLYEDTNIPICFLAPRISCPSSKMIPSASAALAFIPPSAPGKVASAKNFSSISSPAFAPGEWRPAELLDLCQQVAANHGHFRSVHKQLKLAAELKHAKKGEQIISWPDAFRAAHTMLLRQYQLT
jgi:hypothetical protein